MASVVFNASGSWTPPLGVENVTVECWGAGGNAGTATINGGGGGGGGAYARVVNLSVATESRDQTAISITVGTAGADSNFKNATTVMAKGGANGANGTATSAGTGGAGGSGSASVGTTKNSGGNGGNGSATTGGGGGGSAGTDSVGGNASGRTAGSAGSPNGAAGSTGAATVSATTPGSPGGGGGGASTTSARSSGAAGRVTITFDEAGTEKASAAQTTALEAPADSQTNTAAATHASALEAHSDSQTNGVAASQSSAFQAIKDDRTVNTFAGHAQIWQVVSPGLSGVAYTSDGNSTIANAEVLIYRDDTNAFYLSTTSNAEGAWAVPVSNLLTYWISYWSAQGAGSADNLFTRTDKGIAAVITVVSSGT